MPKLREWCRIHKHPQRSGRSRGVRRLQFEDGLQLCEVLAVRSSHGGRHEERQESRESGRLAPISQRHAGRAVRCGFPCIGGLQRHSAESAGRRRREDARERSHAARSSTTLPRGRVHKQRPGHVDRESPRGLRSLLSCEDSSSRGDHFPRTSGFGVGGIIRVSVLRSTCRNKDSAPGICRRPSSSYDQVSSALTVTWIR
jgi:hypothetical protein